jgi:hypothetical protein
MSKSNSGSRAARSASNSTNPNSRTSRTNRSNRSNEKPSQRGDSARPDSSRDRFRRRHPVVAALVPVGLVVAAIATMVVIKAASSPGPAAAASHLSKGGSAATGDPGTSALAPNVAEALAVPSATLDAVGSPASVTLPDRVTGTSVLRGSDGKAVITYVGAEYCPYCAAERWALAVALSRFGTFSNLSGTHSSSSDVYPDTQTLSFYGSTYSSSYLTFQPVEEATNQLVDGTYQTLQTPTAAESKLLASYDPQGSIPFIDIGNTYVVTGASFSPQVLAGLSRSQIASELGDPSTAVAQAIDGAANDITAAICSVTGNQPSSVRDSPTIQAIVKHLGA